MPDSLKKLLGSKVKIQSAELLFKYKEETTVINAEVGDNQLSILPIQAFLKLPSLEDISLTWAAYNKNGLLVYEKETKLDFTDILKINPHLARLWAAKYTLAESKGSLGSLFGFVDKKMSLLALEEDWISIQELAIANEGNVPLLRDNEIFANTNSYTIPPIEDILADVTTGINELDFSKGITYQLSNGFLNLSLSSIFDGVIEIYDMQGNEF